MADSISWEEIISDITCDICGTEFLPLEATYPVFHDCHHTFCCTCADFLYYKNYDCPKCSQPFLRKSLHLTNNFSIEEAPEVFEKLKLFTVEHVDRIRVLVQSLKRRVARFKSRNLRNEITAILYDINQKYRHVENAIDDEEEREPELIKLGNISEFRSYLEQITIKLQNNEKVFVTSSVDDMQYGRVSFWNNTVLFHSLCLPEVPPNSYVVKINDIYVRPNRDCNIAFLNIRYNKYGDTGMMMLDVPATESGECFIFICLRFLNEIWYKNLNYTRGRTMEELEEVVKVVLPGAGTFELPLTPNIRRGDMIVDDDFPIDETVILMDRLGNFKIVRTNHYQTKICYTAKEIKPFTFRNAFDYSDASMLKIVDCGFAIEYNFN